SLVHFFLHARFHYRVDTSQHDVLHRAQGQYLLKRNRLILEDHRSYRNYMAGNFDAEFFQEELGHSAGGHPRRSLTRARSLEHVPRLWKVVLKASRQVGMPGTWTGKGLMLSSGFRTVFDRQGLFPVLPVMIRYQESDGRTDGLAVANPGKKL